VALDHAVGQAIAQLQDLGAEVVDPVDLKLPKEAQDGELAVFLYGLKNELDAYLSSLGPASPVKSLADVIAFNQQHAAEELALFGQEFLIQAQDKGPLTDPDYRKAVAAGARARTDVVDVAFAKGRLDAIVAPTVSPAWLTDPVLGDQVLGGST